MWYLSETGMHLNSSLIITKILTVIAQIYLITLIILFIKSFDQRNLSNQCNQR